MTPLLTFLMLAGALFFGADQRDLLVAIWNGDHATAQKLLAAGPTRTAQTRKAPPP